MKPALYLFLIILVLNNASQAEYLSAFTGYHQGEHQYLKDISSQQGLMLGAQLDYRHWRHKEQGWFARGPVVTLQQAPNMLFMNGQFPLYQWNKHQGSWLEVSWGQQNLETQLTQAQIFMGNDGQPTSLTAGSTISSTRQFQRAQIYWYESTRFADALNIAGLSYSQELTPVMSEISNTNASVFDGTFSGSGAMVGRIKDKRGFNFQWRLNVASLESDFSNDITQHRSLSKGESSVYKFSLGLSWHYRYYLRPYWYLVPQLEYNISYIFQRQLQPLEVEHKSFVYRQVQSWISLRRYF